MVDLEFTMEQEELRASVRTFLEKECPIGVVRAMVETGEAPEKLWESMVALDWPALSVPEEYGGVGLSFVDTAVVVEELGRSVVPGPYLATVTQFAPIVRETGDDAQRRRFLSAVATGGLAGTLALADLPRGAMLDLVGASAERVRGGWLLQGTKRAVMADPATVEVVVVARVGEQVGAYVVPAVEARLTPVLSLDASRPLATATLDGVVVPHDRILGEPGNPATTAGIVRALQEATVAVALETVGSCDALFRLLLSYVKDRRQFGVVVGSFQAVKHKMTNMYLALERARALCYFAVAAIAENSPKRDVAVPMAKAASDECQRLLCRESLQTFGGIGMTWEHDAHLYIKRAEADGALFGGSAEHSVAVATALGATTR
jgi:alkylation response protein AidB-like acyl-CoA dehydrogenase